MAWSSTATDWIIDTVAVRWMGLYVATDAKTFKRSLTTTTKHAPAMTYAAAYTLAEAEKIAHPGADVVIEKQNDAGAYLVRFSNTEWSAWTEVT
jgi:hypothetical protein